MTQIPIEEYNTVIFHVGTNDCNNDSDVEAAEQNYEDMLNIVTQRNPECTKIVSSILPRADGNQERVEKFNKRIKHVVDRQTNCILVNNDATFKPNGKMDMNNLNGSRLHLTPKGTKTLLTNLNKAHAIFKPRKPAKSNPIPSTASSTVTPTPFSRPGAPTKIFTK